MSAFRNTGISYHGAEKKTRTGLGDPFAKTISLYISPVFINFPPDFAAPSELILDSSLYCLPKNASVPAIIRNNPNRNVIH